MWETSVYLTEAEATLKQLEANVEQYVGEEESRQGLHIDSVKQMSVLLRDENWKTLFKLGCLLPNAVLHSEKDKERQYYLSQKLHFQYGYWIRNREKVSVDCFLYKYLPCIYRPLELGYYFHLLMDQTGQDDFYGKNYRALFFNGKHRYVRKNTLLQYIPGWNYEMRPVFLKENISCIITGELYEDQEILAELEKLTSWLMDEENSLDCMIKEVRGYDLRKLLLKEIDCCEQEIMEHMVKTEEPSEFILNLKSNIESLMENLSISFTDSMLNCLDDSGWLVTKSRICLSLKWIRAESASHLREHGIFGSIFSFIKRDVKIYKMLLYKRKQKKDSMQDIIYKQWKEIWISTDKDQIKKDLFYPMFIENYRFVVKKINENRSKNFRFKRLFLLIFFLIAVALVYVNVRLIFIKDNSVKAGLLQILAGSTGIGTVVICASLIGKWMDIKKYQETWVRHSDHKYKLDREMFLYVHELEPYNTDNRKLIFVNKIVEIWDENQKKFVENMENKEKPVMDILEYIKKGKE